MKKGKFILGAVAFLVTTVSALAFKAHNNFRMNKLFTKVDGAHCNQVAGWTAHGTGHTAFVNITVYTTDACQVKWLLSKTTTL